MEAIGSDYYRMARMITCYDACNRCRLHHDENIVNPVFEDAFYTVTPEYRSQLLPFVVELLRHYDDMPLL